MLVMIKYLLENGEKMGLISSTMGVKIAVDYGKVPSYYARVGTLSNKDLVFLLSLLQTIKAKVVSVRPEQLFRPEVRP